MHKIEILNNIDVVNDIILECFSNFNINQAIPSNDVYKGDGFSMDIIETKREQYKFKIRTDRLVNMCIITMDSKCLSVKYSTDFYFVFRELKNNFVLTSNITGKVDLALNTLQDEFEKVFNSTVCNELEIDYKIQADVLEVLIEKYVQFKDRIQVQ